MYGVGWEGVYVVGSCAVGQGGGKGVERLGAGEILLNSIDRDGTGAEFDLDLIRLDKNTVRNPVVASSGAGTPGHFVEVFEGTGAKAALAAGIFHRGEVRIQDVKEVLGKRVFKKNNHN